MDLLLAIVTLLSLAYFVGWEDYIRPALLGRERSVKTSRPVGLPRLRSRRSRRSIAENAVSSQQNGKTEVPNVPANVPANTPLAETTAPGEAFVLSAKELTQLAAALSARAGGATVEESIKAGFGASKGGGPAYRRARTLFDAATAAPK